MSTPKTAKKHLAPVQKESIETVVRAGADAATKGVDKAVAMSKEQVEAAVKAGTAAFKSYEDMLAFSRENVEALVASSSVVVRGVQDLSKSLVTLAQESIDEQVAASKAFIGAKTLREVMDLSSQMAKSKFDKMVAEGARLTEISTKLAEEAFAPITDRVSAAVERITKTAA